MKSETSFLDTNILVYSTDSQSPFHSKARSLLERAREFRFCISPQVIGEFYATITNPKKVTNPLDPREAIDLAEAVWRAEAILKVFPKETTLDLAFKLIKKYRLKALEFFDAQIVATMLDHEIQTLYMANEGDFAGFEEIRLVNPLKGEHED